MYVRVCAEGFQKGQAKGPQSIIKTSPRHTESLGEIKVTAAGTLAKREKNKGKERKGGTDL